MGTRSSLMLQEEEIQEIQQETGFSANQIERLHSRFTSLDKTDNGTLSREDFLRIPELAINPFGRSDRPRVLHGRLRRSHQLSYSSRRVLVPDFRPPSNKKQRRTRLNSREEKRNTLPSRCTIWYDDNKNYSP
uniref:Putative calcium-binding protein p22 n=1 Tax=Ixodes ricinus TaxID=34613 RepID=V5HW85_IXORI